MSEGRTGRLGGVVNGSRQGLCKSHPSRAATAVHGEIEPARRASPQCLCISSTRHTAEVANDPQRESCTISLANRCSTLGTSSSRKPTSRFKGCSKPSARKTAIPGRNQGGLGPIRKIPLLTRIQAGIGAAGMLLGDESENAVLISPWLRGGTIESQSCREREREITNKKVAHPSSRAHQAHTSATPWRPSSPEVAIRMLRATSEVCGRWRQSATHKACAA